MPVDWCGAAVSAHSRPLGSGAGIPDCGHRSARYDLRMKPRTALLLAFSGLLAGCGSEPKQPLGCLQSGDELVIVSGNNPSALDGYDYEICTARTGNPRCGDINRATVNRPVSMTLSLIGGVARIRKGEASSTIRPIHLA